MPMPMATAIFNAMGAVAKCAESVCIGAFGLGTQ
jgi:hypothetical protein